MKGIYGIEFISPLQGLNSWCQTRWMMSIAKILSTFRALESPYNSAIKV
jgi:hypothetical protein